MSSLPVSNRTGVTSTEVHHAGSNGSGDSSAHTAAAASSPGTFPGTSAARHPEDCKGEDVVRALRDDGTVDPRHDPKLKREDVVALYKAMVRTRVLDERLVALQRQGRIGFHIGSLGEEASILGSAF